MLKQKSNLQLGFFGEKAASNYLSSLGYKILIKNFKKRYGEIDLVAIDGRILVFVEVKTRKSDYYGGGEEAITPWKLRALIKSAQYFKLLHPHLPEAMRIDVVTVYLSFENEIEKINHYKNITS